ncbi:LytR/AlgR family response regulator transcription factor [Fundidesulfovibrio putealis]|uniref:LytR/AlgR family response regulator transcription factor n=1 Tax=Fundidesulfovibrio putealis TaxID=270496 RepID=UPI000403D554|nr:response regulator [Fundidesulfovibrio putealis]
MMIHALIVDDEAPARDELAYLLEDHPDVRARQASNAQEALAAIARGDVTLVFQDIQMPGQDGFHVLAEAQDLDHPPVFVFVTAYDQHAIRAFEENAADYLLKPVSPERLAKCLDRVRKLLHAPEAAHSEDCSGAQLDTSGQPLREAVERLLSSVGRAKPLPRLAVEQGGRICLVSTAKVILVEADEKRVLAVTDMGQLSCHGLPTLAKAAERLEGLPFFQANRAQLINLERIAEFSPWFGGKYHVVMNDADRTEITVSRNRVRDFKTRLGI